MKKVVKCLFFVTILISYSHCAPVRGSNDTEEATQIALESIGQLLPKPSLINKIQANLELIRFLDPAMKKVVHMGKWKPGQLLANDINDSQLKEIDESEFKPVKIVNSSSQPSITLLIFNEPFHPERLSELLKQRFGINSQPYYEEQNSEDNHILYNHELSNYYFNPNNGQDCENSCLGQFAVSFDPQEYERNIL